jgi:transcriptional regulator with XRE-family HTH domain
MGDAAWDGFGEFVKARRLQLGFTLREFCGKHGFDIGNWSKVERGKLAPPQAEEKLQKCARALEIMEGSEDWVRFFDLAAVSAGQIPQRILSDEELLPKLPLVFRTISGRPLSPDNLRRLAEDIRRL